MTTRKMPFAALAAAGVALAAAAACGEGAGGGAGGAGGAGGGVEAVAPGSGPQITVSPTLPADLPEGAGLPEAAAYAWQEFIALNWPAVPQNGALGTRDSADASKTFGDSTYAGPLVWHTFRAKIEIFPTPGATPNGYVADAAQSYGYDSLPRYGYVSPISAYASSQGTAPVPWINLDENDEIGLDAMYAGVARGDTSYAQNLLLFMAKANRSEYNYVAANRFFDTTFAKPAQRSSQRYVLANSASPPAGSDSIASLPNGTIEVKAAWRRLTPAEVDSGRFYTTTVRYYRPGGTGIAYVNATFGLIGLHIIRKTPNRPYFVFATFEQADNLLDSAGARVEDENGVVDPKYLAMPPFSPAITSRNAASTVDSGYTLGNVQLLTPDSTGATGLSAGKRLFLVNSPYTATPQGFTAVNRRVHSIPQQVVDANRAAHAAIASYNGGAASRVWQYYKLVNVQYQPIAGKQPGVNYAGADSANFYQANAVLETNHNLQVFSGMFQPSFTYPTPKDTVNYYLAITDWCGANFVTKSGTLPGCSGNGAFSNVRAGGHAFNMGGCMGCHGNAQVAGSDFSFILGEINNKNPQLADPLAAANDMEKFFSIFQSIARPSARAAAAARPAR